MTNKDNSMSAQPEKNDASGCVDQAGANKPEEARILGARIREIREKTGLGRRTVAAEKLGFNHNTIASYETALSLPDIDFLVVFADKTGADLNELLRLRLAASRYPEARALSGLTGKPVSAVRSEIERIETEMRDQQRLIQLKMQQSTMMRDPGVLPAGLAPVQSAPATWNPPPELVIRIYAAFDDLPDGKGLTRERREIATKRVIAALTAASDGDEEMVADLIEDSAALLGALRLALLATRTD